MLKQMLNFFGSMNENWGYLLIAVIFAVVLFIALVVKKPYSGMKTKQLVCAALAIALAMATSYIRIFTLPYGGSITLFSMFFICLIGNLYGPVVGMTTALAYGIFQLINDAYIIHPAQLLLDYILGFGALGIAGFFWKSKYGLMKGYIIGVFGRYLCSVLSGIIFFSEYAPKSMPSVLYSIIYNAICILLEGAITAALLSLPILKHSIMHVKKLAADY